ncbi:MAG: hypothetical protein DRI26_00205 [Chloroflexi bacterium]|nr:MAG: hypothetical protein DRI26_00205 [Chloroflexota bacterium]
MPELTSIIAPFVFLLDDVVVTIYEVIPLTGVEGTKSYHVELDLTWRGVRSRRFFLDARNFDELKKKLLVEIAKFKLFILLGKAKVVSGV